MLRRIDKPNAGQACIACPFCGARLGAPPVMEGTPATHVDVYPDSPQYAAWCEQAERGEGPLAVPQEGEE